MNQIQNNDLASKKIEFEKNGVVFFDRLLPLEIENKLREEVDRLLIETTDANKLLNLHFSNGVIREICTRKEFAEIASQLLGDNSVQIVSSLILVKPGKSKMIVPWHQDAAYDWPLEPIDTVSLWFALDDVTVANGAMKLALGGHLSGKLPMRTTPPLKEDEYFFSTQLKESIADEHIDKYKVIDCVMRSGECSFHHCFLPHSSKPNETDGRRCAFIVRYCKGVARIVRYPGMPREDYFKDYELYKVN